MLQYNIENKFIGHDFFKDVKEFVLNIIKTEGIFSPFGEMTIKQYVNYLRDLRESIDNESFEEFMNDRHVR